MRFGNVVNVKRTAFLQVAVDFLVAFCREVADVILKLADDVFGDRQL